MQCTNCGHPLAAGATFCENCGQTVALATANNQTEPYAYAQQNMQSNANDQQGQVQQGGYQAPYQTQPPSYNAQPAYAATHSSEPLGVGGFLITMLVFAIPIVGIVMMFIWAFGSGGNINRRNYARATLIVALIGIVLSILFASVFATIWATIISEMAGGFGAEFDFSGDIRSFI